MRMQRQYGTYVSPWKNHCLVFPYKNLPSGVVSASRMFTPTLIFVWLFSVTAFCALPDFQKRYDPHLVQRAVSDPCCKSCGPIMQIFNKCPLATADIFCGCNVWVRAGPPCQACIYIANTTYAPVSPLLEDFWAFCQCQKECKEIAEAIFAPKPCASGTNVVCLTDAFIKHGPKCNKCLKTTDEWFSASFEIFIEESEKFKKTRQYPIPGKNPLR